MGRNSKRSDNYIDKKWRHIYKLSLDPATRDIDWDQTKTLLMVPAP